MSPGADVTVSATLFMTYSRCPDQALGRLHGLYPEESRASFRGGLAHRVFARHLSSGPIESGQFEHVCREEIGAGLNPALGSLGLRPSELAAVIKEVGDLYQRFKALSSEGFREAEVFLENQPASGVTLRGSVDAVFDSESGFRLIDWKTGGLYETSEQLSFYALLWSLVYRELPASVEAVSIGSGESIVARPTEESVRATAVVVAEMISQLRAGLALAGAELDKAAGPWCRYCALLSTCREGAAAVKLADA